MARPAIRTVGRDDIDELLDMSGVLYAPELRATPFIAFVADDNAVDVDLVSNAIALLEYDDETPLMVQWGYTGNWYRLTVGDIRERVSDIKRIRDKYADERRATKVAHYVKKRKRRKMQNEQTIRPRIVDAAPVQPIRDPWTVMEKVVVQGDLSKLTAEERVSYYRHVCESVGLNPLTQPFAYVTLSGRLTLYAMKNATDQIRRIHNVNVAIVGREQVGDVYVVTAKATMPDGRTDESIGAVPTMNLKGDALANALMKCETKAKRRVTLSIVGLGMLDETETETIPDASYPQFQDDQNARDDIGAVSDSQKDVQNDRQNDDSESHDDAPSLLAAFVAECESAATVDELRETYARIKRAKMLDEPSIQVALMHARKRLAIP